MSEPTFLKDPPPGPIPEVPPTAVIRLPEPQIKHASITSLCFRPDGRVYAMARDGRVVIASTEIGIPLLATPKHVFKHYGVAWSRDGRYLASAQREVVVRDLETGTELRPIDSGRVTALAFTTDSRGIVLGHDDGHVSIHELAAGEPIDEYQPHHGTIHAIDVAGSRIATIGEEQRGTPNERELTLRDASGAVRRSRGLYFDVELSADGQRVLLATGGKAEVWDLAGDRWQSSQPGWNVVAATWVGEEIAWVSKVKGGDAEVFVGRPGTRPRLQFLAGKTQLDALALGPHGLLVVGGGDGVPRLLDVRDGRLVAMHEPPPPPPPSAATRTVETTDFRIDVPVHWQPTGDAETVFTAPDGSFVGLSVIRPAPSLGDVVTYKRPPFEPRTFGPFEHPAGYTARVVTLLADDGREQRRVYIVGTGAMLMASLDAWGELPPQVAVDFAQAMRSMRWK